MLNPLMADQMPLCINLDSRTPEPSFVLDIDGRVLIRSAEASRVSPIPYLIEAVSVRETERHPDAFSLSLGDILSPIINQKWLAANDVLEAAYPFQCIRQYEWRYIDQETILSKLEAIDMAKSLVAGCGPDKEELNQLNLWYEEERQILWSCHSGISMAHGQLRIHKSAIFTYRKIDEVIR